MFRKAGKVEENRKIINSTITIVSGIKDRLEKKSRKGETRRGEGKGKLFSTGGDYGFVWKNLRRKNLGD